MTRQPYQGVAQIFRYNRPFYLGTLIGVFVVLMVSASLPTPIRAMLLLASGSAVFWICSSLLASFYVYDRSPLYSLSWLTGCLTRVPAHWLYVHAGLDECSRVIASVFPDSRGLILDIYDPREMTEPSIGRARRVSQPSSVTADWRALPVADQSCDVAFLIFSAHELRTEEARVQLFREAARTLRSGGEVVLVEHLRDWANFLAFGPGFLHFFSVRTWRNAALAAGLVIRLHRTVTPFIHVFVLRRRT
jgi:hypothetical protein